MTHLTILIYMKLFAVTPFSSLKVVNRIREVPHRTRLLVVDRETEDYLCSHGLACTEDLAIEMGTLSPRPSPGQTPCISPRANSPMTPSYTPVFTPVFHYPAAESPTRMITQGKVKSSSVTSSIVTDPEVRVSIKTLFMSTRGTVESSK